ncbi:Alpha/Beta hydrolase protein [Chaetomium sp. MPI-CAGE-AT-0009]|nr:Alpha/Beta hydrolase protein [Chaetomium sp. MPI-CAGE-AT-0009]
MADAALSATGLNPSTAFPPPTSTSSPPGTQPPPPDPEPPFHHPPPFHLSLNPTQPTTLLLLHGLLSTHLEYTHVLPHLSAYHLLLVDLPGHSHSFSPSTPPLPENYTLASMADAVAPLIQAHAKHGRAHVVGLSMGGFVALELARRHPALCRSVWVTGAAPLGGLFAWMASRPRWVDGFMWLVESLPEGVYKWLAAWQGMREHGEMPEVFAEGVKAWVEGRELPGEFEVLE